MGRLETVKCDLEGFAVFIEKRLVGVCKGKMCKGKIGARPGNNQCEKVGDPNIAKKTSEKVENHKKSGLEVFHHIGGAGREVVHIQAK